MATHTHSGSGNTTRWFSIGRKNFEDAGKPVFKEYMKKLPPELERTGRAFEERNGAFYEVFEMLDGVFTKPEWKVKKILDRDQYMFSIILEDGSERYIIEIGNWDGRYSMNFMQRICDPRFNPGLKIAVTPYAGTNRDTGKPYFGLNVTNGVDKETSKPLQLDTRKAEPGVFDLPRVEPTVEKDMIGPGQYKEKTVYDFKPQAKFLVEYIIANIKPKLPVDVWEIETAANDHGNDVEDVSEPVSSIQDPKQNPPGGDQFWPDEQNAQSNVKSGPTSTDDLPF